MAVWVCWLKTGHRRPILLHPPVNPKDLQAQIPFGWCSNCGKPVYEEGSTQCCRCKEKEDELYERFTQ